MVLCAVHGQFALVILQISNAYMYTYFVKNMNQENQDIEDIYLIILMKVLLLYAVYEKFFFVRLQITNTNISLFDNFVKNMSQELTLRISLTMSTKSLLPVCAVFGQFLIDFKLL